MRNKSILKLVMTIAILVTGIAGATMLLTMRMNSAIPGSGATPVFAIYLAEENWDRDSPDLAFDPNTAKLRVTDTEIDMYFWETQTIVLNSDVAIGWPKLGFSHMDPEWARFAIMIAGRPICNGHVQSPTSAAFVNHPIMQINPPGPDPFAPAGALPRTGISIFLGKNSSSLGQPDRARNGFPCGTVSDAQEVKQLFTRLEKLR